MDILTRFATKVLLRCHYSAWTPTSAGSEQGGFAVSTASSETSFDLLFCCLWLTELDRGLPLF